MMYFSTKHASDPVSLKEAVLNSLPSDRGLYMPEKIPRIFNKKGDLEGSFLDLSFRIAWSYLKEDFEKKELHAMLERALSFEPFLVEFKGDCYILELFHGPTLAFKDFGARFMAQLMGHFVKSENRLLDILVATSGDTGSAVASGFFQVDGVRVTILFPKGGVSPLQEKQLSTFSGNIRSIAVEGSFDDCQKLVKKAFLDGDLNQNLLLSSANSINWARLLPQMFYYAYACQKLKAFEDPLVISIPSGNFGNLSAALMGKKMGLPIHRLIAACNVNDAVVSYLETGTYQAKKTKKTLSNAMDVGNPSNFQRMLELYKHSHAEMSKDIYGCRFSDQQCQKAIQGVKKKNNYILDPHGAIAYLGWQRYVSQSPSSYRGLVLATAHPGKFLDVIETALQEKIPLPLNLEEVLKRPSHLQTLSNNYDDFKGFLMDR